MKLWTILKDMIVEPHWFFLFLITELGWLYLALFLTAILCLIFAVKKGSVGLMISAYVVEVLPFALSLWHFYTSNDLATVLTGMAAAIYLFLIPVTLIVHLQYRHHFKKVPPKEPDWPAPQD